MAEQEKLGVGLFGMGWVAGEHIKGYMNNPRCEIKALASRKRTSAQEKKEIYGLDCDILDTFNKMGHSGWFSMLGDFGAQGAFQEWNAWFNYTYNGRTCSKELTAQYPLLPILGNHEM